MTEKLPPEIRLTDEESENFTPAEKFDRWIEINQKRMNILYAQFGKEWLNKKIDGLKNWLRDPKNAHKALKRKNWYMFILKNVSKTRKYSYAGKSKQQQREQPSKFTGKSGQRKMS